MSIFLLLRVVPDPPSYIKVKVISSTSLNVSWVASNTTFFRGILRKYRVIFTSMGSVFPHTTRNVTTPADTLSVVLNGLYKYTEYDIQVTAITISDGEPSLPVSAQTDSDSKFTFTDHEIHHVCFGFYFHLRSNISFTQRQGHHNHFYAN